LRFSADPRTEVADKLKPIASAYYDSDIAPTGCLHGTRVSIQAQLAEWANDGAEGLSTLWLSGMAGTGKTAIVSTFASSMADEGILGATFFIDRQQAERRERSRIVQTLAYDLGKHSHAQLQAMWAVLRDDPTFERLSFEKQAQLLIKEPLDVVRPGTLVVVIDGLDECGISEGASLLKTLATSLAGHPIKLLVSSRNEVDIANTFRDVDHRSIKLQEIEASGDVRLYWEHKLDQLCHFKRLPDWRPLVSLQRLVEMTGHLFIYATTILDIITNFRTSPIKRLNEMLEISGSEGVPSTTFHDTISHNPLERLYLYIISEAVKDNRGDMRTEYVLRLHDILEVVIFAAEPLTAQALSDLLDMDKDELDGYLSPLCSVLELPDVSDPERVVRVMHQSFPDFVRQKGDLVHSEMTIHAIIGEKHLAERCMFQLNKYLHVDMCHVRNPSLFNHEILDLETRLRQYVTAALRYSCRFWIAHWLKHIRAAGPRAQVPDGLHDFCAEHILHWIEVVSLTGNLHAVHQAILDLMLEIEVCRLTLSVIVSALNVFQQGHFDWNGMELVELLSDARFLMRDHYTPITLSALQVYHSGAVTMRECALRKKTVDISVPHLISEREHGWQTGMNRLYGHTSYVTSVACSIDGLRIVSGSYDETVRMWDAALGTVQHIMEGHTHWVSSVAFSSDGLRIVSGSYDRTVRIWDAVSGTTQHTMEGHTGWVTSVAFSSDGLRIVSGSYDCAVRMWDAASGTIRHILEGHTKSVTSVAFSPDGLRIVSGSDDETVRIWDAGSGKIHHTMEGQTGWMTSVAFSPDSLRIVSGSCDNTVRIWDVASGTIQHILEGHTKSVTSVAFSPDGLRIVSGSDDETVRIWNAGSGTNQHILGDETSWEASVLFSSDGLRIVSGSNDNTVGIWDAASGTIQDTLEGYTSSVTSVAFSSDGLQIVSSSNDNTVRIWDAASGTIHHTMEGHASKVTSVAFSSDGLQIVSGSRDETVRIWDAASGTVQHTLKGHTSTVTSVAFSSNDLRIVSGSYDRTVRIWDAVSSTVQHTLEGHTNWVTSVDFSPNSLRIVSGSSDDTVRIWDAVSGTTQHILKGHKNTVNSVAFSSDSSQIVSGSHDRTVRVWDVVLGMVQHTLEGHADKVTSVAFSSDGLRIVSGSYDETVRIWDAKTGAMQHILKEYYSWQSLSFFLAASTLRNGWCFLITKSPLLIHDYHSLTEVIMDSSKSNGAFGLDERQGWVSRLARDGSSQRMCWLPHQRRHGGHIAWSGQKVVIGAESGIVTILDFSDV
jgi:WD40 repeat protein